jgi:hypothetical protein
MKIWPCVALTCAVLGPLPALAHSPAPTAVFNFELDDTSPLPPQAADQARLRALDAQLPALLEKSGCCEILPLGSLAKQAAETILWRCSGCDVDLARRRGAGISVVGWVQKVSNLILNINLVARNVATGQVIEAGSVDIRGDTDESWSRGLSYLVRNRLHPSGWQMETR